MDDLEDKLGQLLSDPETMRKVMSLAQSLNKSPPEPPSDTRHSDKEPDNGGILPEIDLAMIQKISGFAAQSGIDKNQQNLLNALAPYLSKERILKLEKAMRAAKMAKIATTFLIPSGNSR